MRAPATVVLLVTLAACGEEPQAAPRTQPAEAPRAVSAEPALPPHVDYAAPAEPGEVPDEHRGTGDCALRLRLRDADEGTPVAMYVRLWRLGVDEDAAFTGGDHIQSRFTVGLDGSAVERLPAGRYRVEVPDQRRGTDDPPELSLVSGATERVLDVRPRRMHRVRLRVYDETGALLRHLNGEIERDDWVPPGPRLPPRWATLREEKDAPAHEPEFPPGKPTQCFFVRRTLPPLDGGADGLDLGEVRDAGRIDAPSVSAEIQRKGCNDVMASASGAEINAAEVSLVAVSVPHATLMTGVELPDGTDLETGRGRVAFAICRPLRCAAEPPPDAWRRATVHVSVEVAGYETLAYEWSADTADERHVLVERRAR